MNRIRTAAAAVAMLVGAATVASAQTPAPQQGQAGMAHRGQHGMMGNLDLTDAQNEQIKAIHAKYRVQFQQLQERSQAEVRAVLTAEQRTKFDARQAQMRERMAQRDSSQRKAGQRGMQGRRPMRGARPGRPRGQN